MSPGRYRFGDVAARGMIGAIRPGQLIVAAVGIGSAVAMIDLAPSGAGVLAALLALAAAAFAATVPVGGLTLEQWLPLTSRWILTLLGGQNPTQPTAASIGTVVALPTTSASRPPRVMRGHEPSAPRELRGVRILELPYRNATIGAISERSGRRMTVVLAGRAPGFALADEGEQQQRLSVWGETLKSACRMPVRRIQWIERTAPAEGDGLARWLCEQRDPKIGLDGRIARSYVELINSSAQATREHEVLLAVQIDAARLRNSDRGQRDRALITSAERLVAGLERARVQIDRALTAGGIARVLRVAYDPYFRAQLAALRAGGGGDELSEAAAWPAATSAAWGHYRTDAAVHATFEIGGWPRADVGPAFLGPLLGSSEQVRTVAVVFEPLDPVRSLRQAEYDITRAQTDQETRRRWGQVETSRQRKASEAAQLRESELASGHGEVRLAGFVTVCGRDSDELALACEDVVAQAGRANLELRLLYGQQAQAFTFTLPLCRGLR